MFRSFLQNHVLANLTFVLVLVLGITTYIFLPREQDPAVNFNWIAITTLLPGASALDVEKRITDPLEEVIRKVPDMRFVNSTSREGTSSILVRFNEISERVFDKRVTDLRREIQNKTDELPDEAFDPFILEITSGNAYPTASLVVTSAASDENLRVNAERIKKDLEQLKGIDRIDSTALHDPELQVLFEPETLHKYGLKPGDIADTVRNYYQDTSAGSRQVHNEEWFIRLTGARADPEYLSSLPVMTSLGKVRLGEIAVVQRAREKAERLVNFNGDDAVMLAVFKKSNTNTLKIVEKLNDYIDEWNETGDITGVKLTLIDDATELTRKSIRVMQNNALLGLMFVLFVTWLFLGFRIAFLTSIGIPFILAGTFWALGVLGQSLNVMVLLGAVISLGMLVDDAVVVVESIYERLNHGVDRLTACIDSLKEVFAPVTAAVFTTIAAFSPLMLMTGIMGQFLKVVPLVVTIALLISLVEAYWMLPAHILASKAGFSSNSSIHSYRRRFTHLLQLKYIRLLIRVMRYPKTAIGVVLLAFVFAVTAVASGVVKFDFFASDPQRKFYVNIEMPPGTPLESTLQTTLEIESRVRDLVDPQELRAMVSYAGQLFTETEALFGDQYGQIIVSLSPDIDNAFRSVDDVLEVVRESVSDHPGPLNISFYRISGGPPVAKPISIKVRGDDLQQIAAAAEQLKQILRSIPAIHDITDDASRGRNELRLSFDMNAVRDSGLTPAEISRNLRLLVDGEIVASMQDKGEELEVRVKAVETELNDINQVLRTLIALPAGGARPLNTFLNGSTGQGPGNIRHYNFRRAITVEADLDTSQMNTVQANNLVKEKWAEFARQYPQNDLNYSGQLDDLQESLDSMLVLFMFGVLLIYVILGTQFRSYFQPIIIIFTIPMAFTGVTLGLLLTGNPISLYTVFGLIALTGIAVNAAIVLISAANDRLKAGMTITHATLYAARRRIIPIIITTLTTIAGLSGLALGLGGTSLIWGPVATAIVSGLAFSSLLTLFAIPLLYRLFVKAPEISRDN
jgi:multidrug efflux pump subunit AcrB